MKPRGIDFGRYTQWQTSPTPIDFVIAGVTSGNYVVNHYSENLPFYLQEPRLMAYHFFEPVSAQVQADIFSQKAEECGAKALWIDWENYSGHALTTGDVNTLTALYGILNARFPRVGIYSNHDSFIVC